MNDAAARRIRWVGIAVAVGILSGCRTVARQAVEPATVALAAAAPAPPPAPAAAEVRAVSYQTAAAPLPPALPADDCPTCRGGVAAPDHGGVAAACAAGCEAPVCFPVAPPPFIVPPPICDGGDHGRLAVPFGRDGLANVTSGDTVARFRAADAPDPEQACLTTSNCACVFAPRFASVREVIRPFEDAAPAGPNGVVLDAGPEAGTRGERVCRITQPLNPEAARRAQPPVAAEEILPSLAVDTARIPGQAEGLEGPAAKLAIDRPERKDQVVDPRTVTGFEVPYVWTCLSAAQVTVGGESTDVIAVDRGTATLRLEHPGRCELTLCKRAGSDAVKPGEELDFTIYLLNSGARTLADIVLVDAVPARLDVIPGSAVSNLPADVVTGPAEDGSTLLTWKLRGELPPGAGGFVRFRTIVR